MESLHSHPLFRSGARPRGPVSRARLALALCLLAPAPASALEEHTSDDLARAAARLDAEESAHAAAWLARELASEEQPGALLLRSALALGTTGREAWPLAAERGAYGPGDPALAGLAGLADLPPVEFLAPEDERTRALLEDRAELRGERRDLPARVVYDDTSGELRRIAERGDGAVLLGAAHGYAPETDWAEALLERALDTGAARAELAALERAWVDDQGRAHRGLSLLDALRGDAPLALRPVDLVGVVRAVDGPDAAAWPPDPAALAGLETRVLELHARATLQRALRKNLARTALAGTPPLDPAAGGSLYRLHAVWRAADDDPARVRAELPAAGEEQAWLDAWAERYRKQAVRKGALQRSKTLAAYGAQVRTVLAAILEEYGAFDGRGTSLADVPDSPPRGPAPDVRPASQPVPAAPDPAAREPATVTPAVHTPSRSAPSIAWDPAALPALETRFEGLKRRAREALVAACLEAALASGAAQVELVERWSRELRGAERELPARDRFDAHDAKQYRGGPPRREVKPGNRHWQALASMISGNDDWERTRDVHYEFATGRIARDADADAEAEDWRTLALLLDGVLPDQDLAEALVLSELDRGGPVRKEAEYFAHTYADREARAYRGITLFDAWTSGIELEIPDPDARAYAAKLWDDTSVPVPLGAEDHALWYPRMELSLKRLRDHRDAARALAALWFQGRPELPGQYENSTDILQARIALAGEDPSALRDELQEHGAGFAGRALARVKSEGTAGWNAGNARRDALLAGREAIRQAVLGVLQERGLLAP